MKTPQQTMDAINTVLVKNQTFIDRLSEIYRTVETYVDTTIDDPGKIDLPSLDSLQMESFDLEKKIKDNNVTINDLVARAVMTDEYYTDQANIFLKRVAHVSNDIPSISGSGVIITSNIIFKNLGMFYSWTLDKNIKLNVVLMDGDNNVIGDTDYPFDPTYTGNEPGEETTNGDYEKDKTFHISLLIVPCPPGDYFFVLTVKDDTYSFFDVFKPAIQIV